MGTDLIVLTILVCKAAQADRVSVVDSDAHMKHRGTNPIIEAANAAMRPLRDLPTLRSVGRR